jgi:hypothetical protein
MIKYLLFICSCVCLLPVAYGQEESTTVRQHVWYAALGSPSLYGSVNYELSVFERSSITLLPRVGLGFNFFQPSVGEEWNLNTGVTGLYGKKKGKLEATVGLVHQVYPSYVFDRQLNEVRYKGIIYGGVGYRYQPTKGVMFKVLFTPTFTVNSDKWVFYPYAELGIGYVLRKE